MPKIIELHYLGTLNKEKLKKLNFPVYFRRRNLGLISEQNRFIFVCRAVTQCSKSQKTAKTPLKSDTGSLNIFIEKVQNKTVETDTICATL